MDVDVDEDDEDGRGNESSERGKGKEESRGVDAYMVTALSLSIGLAEFGGVKIVSTKKIVQQPPSLTD